MNDYLPPEVIDAAGQLACAVRDYDTRLVARILNANDPAAIAVTLAAMVDIDRTPSDLLAWNDAAIKPGGRRPLPHGTHAAFNLHRFHGQEPCESCRAGEREYQRARQRRRRDCRTVDHESSAVA
jgi:hypothetical protein